MGLRKTVKPEFGGGTRSFSCEEDYIYENIESELCFFTSQVSCSFSHSLRQTYTRLYNQIPSPSSPHLSQERQSIIKYWMDNLRAKHGEVLHNINFLEGQPISKSHSLVSLVAGMSRIEPTNLILCVIGWSAVPELSARGVIRQVFPLHEQRILSQLMKSWVQAVCEKQPLGWQIKENH